MTLSSRLGFAARRRLAARSEVLAWGTVVVPPETRALIASRNALQIKAVVEEAGAWLALVGLWVVSLLVLAIAIGFV